MAGTLATYQGYPASDVTIRRSPGLEPDGGVIIIPLRAFPDRFRFSVAPFGKLGKPGDKGPSPNIGALQQGKPDAAPDRTDLHVAGTLVLAESVGAQTWEVRVPNLYVRSAEVVRQDPRGVSAVQLVVTDVRTFWDRGFLPRFAFNKPKGDGTNAEDTLDGSRPWTLASLVAFIAANLVGEPKILEVPDAWQDITPSFDFGGPIRTVDALRRVLDRYPARPVLNWDGSLSFFVPGTGKIGHGARNAQALPDAKEAEGDVLTRSYGYPPDFVVVWGKPILYTVAIDCAEPVMVLAGEVLPIEVAWARLLHGDPAKEVTRIEREIAALREQLARGPNPAIAGQIDALQGDLQKAQQKGRDQKATDAEMNRLRALVLKPSSMLAAQDLPSETLQIVRELAFRLWRIAGAETWARHLLPLRPRAETDAQGRSLPVTVVSYRWRLRQAVLKTRGGLLTTRGSGNEPQELRDLRQAQEELARLRRLMVSLGVGRGLDASQLSRLIPDEFSDLLTFTPFGPALVGAGIIHPGSELASDMLPAAWDSVLQGARRDIPTDDQRGLTQTFDAVTGFANDLRAAEQADGIQSGLGKQYLDTIERVTSLQNTLSGDQVVTSDLDLEIARALDAYAKELDGASDEQRDQVREVSGNRARAIDLLKQRSRRLLDAERRAREGTRREQEGELATIVHVVNEPASPDITAEVYDADQGIIRTEDPAGWLEDVEVHAASDTRLKDHHETPMRIIFGSTARVPIPGTRVETGRGGCNDHLPPRVTKEEETHYVSAWRRKDNDVEAVKLADVVGSEAHVEITPMVQRVSLNGDSTKPALDAEAEKIARTAVQEQPVIEGARALYLRPWEVNPNGIIAGVEITARRGMIGMNTLVVSGQERAPFEGGNKTQLRPRPVDAPPPRRAEDP